MLFDRVHRVVDRVDHLVDRGYHGVADLIFFVFLKGRDFPPVAIGPHYLMSSDCVAFLTKNKQVLRGVGTLEDVSISVWLRAYGVVRWSHCVRLPSRCTQSPVFCSFLSLCHDCIPVL